MTRHFYTWYVLLWREFKKKWHTYLLQFVFAMLATFLGVWAAFSLDKWQSNNDSKHRFETQLLSVESELESNLTLIRAMKNNVSVFVDPLSKLSTTAQSYLLNSADAYTFAGMNLSRTVMAAKAAVEGFDKYCDARFVMHSHDRGFNEAMAQDFKKLAETVEFQVLLARAVVHAHIREKHLNQQLLKKSIESAVQEMNSNGLNKAVQLMQADKLLTPRANTCNVKL